MARRRTVGLSSSATGRRAGRPGRRWRRAAATAASRQRASSWPVAVAASAGTAGRCAALGQVPGGADDDQRVGVLEGGGEGGGERRAGAACRARQGGLDGAAAQRGRAAGQRGGDVGGAAARPGGPGHPAAATCTEGSAIGEAPAGQGDVAAVAGHGDAAAAHGGAAVAARIRGRIFLHPSEYVRPHAPADGDAAAIPTSRRHPPPRGRSCPTPRAAAGIGSRRRRRRRRIGAAACWRAVWPCRWSSSWRPGRQPGQPQLLRHHAGGRHAGVAVHRGAAAVQPPPDRHHPADGRLRDPAERAQLPAVPLLRLRQRDRFGPRPARAPTPNENQYLDQGYLADGAGPDLRHGGGAVPPGLHGEVDQRRARSIFGIQPDRRRPKSLQVAQIITAVKHADADRVRPHQHAAWLPGRAERVR